MRPSPLRLARSRLKQLSHAAHIGLWFPHVPLAVLLALGGLLLLRVDVGAGWSPYLAEVAARHQLLRAGLLPQLLLGSGMIIIAFGLVLRSRVAWIMALMLAAIAAVSLVPGHHQSAAVLIAYFVLLCLALLVARGHFTRSSVAASTLFALTSVVMLLLYATFGAYYLGNDFSPPITSLVTALYYSVETTSTVGYGDIIPQTPEAKLFSISVIVLGVAVFATSLTAVVAPLVTRSLQRIANRDSKHMKRENHFVVIGNTSLAINTWRELANRGRAVTRIIREPPTSDLGDTDVIVGEPGNVDVLSSAGVEKAVAVLAMLDDDSENAFVVLAVRELGSHARTVVAVNDSRHLSRIRLVQPDVVIAPQVLGGELAAMIVCDEEVTSDFVLRSVLQQTPAAGDNQKT